mmetsp:Transcript_12667/g.20101  ORF Transcript_12667/g.20101 Transcript_12667/m.20101 type:complete len:284 (-) Transcript_12667:43-894(-)
MRLFRHVDTITAVLRHPRKHQCTCSSARLRSLRTRRTSSILLHALLGLLHCLRNKPLGGLRYNCLMLLLHTLLQLSLTVHCIALAESIVLQLSLLHALVKIVHLLLLLLLELLHTRNLKGTHPKTAKERCSPTTLWRAANHPCSTPSSLATKLMTCSLFTFATIATAVLLSCNLCRLLGHFFNIATRSFHQIFNSTPIRTILVIVEHPVNAPMARPLFAVGLFGTLFAAPVAIALACTRLCTTSYYRKIRCTLLFLAHIRITGNFHFWLAALFSRQLGNVFGP